WIAAARILTSSSCWSLAIDWSVNQGTSVRIPAMASRVPPINPYPGLPYRGDPSHRPTGLALPPDRMPLFHGRRPRKRWRYVGVFGAQAMICAAQVRVAGLCQSFWAVWDRERSELRERTSCGGGEIELADGVLM